MAGRDGHRFIWVLAGRGVGSLVGRLYAPNSVSEPREVLRSKADEGREFMRNRARQARERAADLVDRGRDVMNQQKDQFRAADEAGRQAYREEVTAKDSGAAQNL